MTAAYTTPAFRWCGDNGTRWDPDNVDEVAWGGTFTHFFFEGLELGKNEDQSFSYAYTNTNLYAFYAHLPDEWTDQRPQSRDNIDTTWL